MERMRRQIKYESPSGPTKRDYPLQPCLLWRWRVRAASWGMSCQQRSPLLTLCEDTHQPTHPDNPGSLKAVEDDLSAEDTQVLEEIQRHSKNVRLSSST